MRLVTVDHNVAATDSTAGKILALFKTKLKR